MSEPNSSNPQGANQTINQHGPVLAYCPTCTKTVVTEVQISYSKLAHVTCVCCIFFGCFFGCCLLPYFSMCFVTAKHYCPDCGSHLASFNPLLEYLH